MKSLLKLTRRFILILVLILTLSVITPSVFAAPMREPVPADDIVITVKTNNPGT